MKHLLIACLFALGAPAFVAREPQNEPAERREKKDLPLETERTIEFETSEGSWISLDVAPNGRDIVFELLGDLYTLPMRGGEARRITSGVMFDTQPRYSPDGSKVVFLSDRSGDENVWARSTAPKRSAWPTISDHFRKASSRISSSSTAIRSRTSATRTAFVT